MVSADVLTWGVVGVALVALVEAIVLVRLSRALVAVTRFGERLGHLASALELLVRGNVAYRGSRKINVVEGTPGRAPVEDIPVSLLENDFAERIDPKLLNRRQLESLAAAGAFDALNPDRPAVHAAAETILAHASAAHEQRTSGQHGLFGGGGSSSGVAPIRLPKDARWTLAERMTAEREAFGFYFSAHPVDAQRHLLAAHKVRSFADISTLALGEGRSTATMAGLIEGARWPYVILGVGYATLAVSMFVVGEVRKRAVDRALDEGGYAPLPGIWTVALSGLGGLLAIVTLLVVLLS